MSLRLPLLIVAAAALVGACTAQPPASGPPEAAVATTADGRYTLTFSLPKAEYAAGEDITGRATLSLEPGPDAPISGSGTIIAFGFKEVGGSREMGPASNADCRRHELSAARPITEPLGKSGGWSDDMPDADFYREFFGQPGIHLPAGDWDVTAFAQFTDGGDCSGAPHDLQAPVRIHVTHGPATSP